MKRIETPSGRELSQLIRVARHDGSSQGAPSALSLGVECCRMSIDRDRRLADLLHEAAETHHTVYRITNGDDPDWASWYATWLLDLSELSDVLGRRPVRSHLVHALVQLDREYTTAAPAEAWEDWYAVRLRDLVA
jgi:hypothetical protein